MIKTNDLVKQNRAAIEYCDKRINEYQTKASKLERAAEWILGAGLVVIVGMIVTYVLIF